MSDTITAFTAKGAELLSRARELVPTFRKRAAEAEKLRCIPPESIDDLRDVLLADLVRLRQQVNVLYRKRQRFVGALPRGRTRASIRSKPSEEPKTAYQRKQTLALARTQSERRHKEPLAHLPIALRPSRPIQQWVFHQAQTGIDISPGTAI